MNIEYMRIKDKVFVTEEYGNVYEREYEDNIEEILINENRLETLKNLIDEDNVKLKKIKTSIKPETKLKDLHKLMLDEKNKQEIQGIIFAYCIFGIVLPLGIGLVFSNIPLMLGISLVFIVATSIGNNMKRKEKIKEIMGLESKINKALEEKNIIEESLNKIRTIIEEDYLIEESQKETNIFLNKMPCFNEIDDKEYLKNLRKKLEYAYNDGIRQYEQNKPKTKALKKFK